MAYLSPGRSRTEAEISPASGHSFSTSSRGPHRDLLKPRKDFFTERLQTTVSNTTVLLETRTCLWEKYIFKIKFEAKGQNPIIFKCVTSFHLCTFKAMFEAVLHDNKELLKRWVVRVQSSSKAQSRLDQPLNAQLGHVQQVGSLHGHWVTKGCTKKVTFSNNQLLRMCWFLFKSLNCFIFRLFF